jgi:hypothetical protein
MSREERLLSTARIIEFWGLLDARVSAEVGDVILSWIFAGRGCAQFPASAPLGFISINYLLFVSLLVYQFVVSVVVPSASRVAGRSALAWRLVPPVQTGDNLI